MIRNWRYRIVAGGEARDYGASGELDAFHAVGLLRVVRHDLGTYTIDVGDARITVDAEGRIESIERGRNGLTHGTTADYEPSI